MTTFAGQAVLSSKLCPWLREPFERCRAAIASDRLGHAWLIHGIAGVGKLNLAFLLADRLLSGSREESTETLSLRELKAAMDGRRQLQNHHPDLHYVFPEDDKTTIGIEQIRDVIETLTLKGFAGESKVVIIEPAEAMTTAAANALLKTLEEPTAHSYLLLVSHCPGRLPATIRSRCQRLSVRRPAATTVADWATLGRGATAASASLEGLVDVHTPLELADALDPEQHAARDGYAREVIEIRSGRADPIHIADAWTKRDANHALSWLVQALQHTIRERLVARGSTPITESTRSGLHTALEGLSLRGCFDQLDKAEALRDQLGGGINAQLALRVLLLGFRPERDTT